MIAYCFIGKQGGALKSGISYETEDKESFTKLIEELFEEKTIDYKDVKQANKWLENEFYEFIWISIEDRNRATLSSVSHYDEIVSYKKEEV